MGPNLHVVTHPLVGHCLCLLRDEKTPAGDFRSVTQRVTGLLALEATRDLETSPITVQTPLEQTTCEQISQGIVVVPVLRAGVGMLEPVLELFPDTAVGYMGMERDEETARANSYYQKLPDLRDRLVLVVDPMLATGGTATSSLRRLYELDPRKVRILCIVAAPEGVDAIWREFPEQEIYTLALDRELDDRKFILPGLGDFGDRLYGTL